MDFSGIERGGRAAAEAIMRGSEQLGAGIRSAGASIGDAISKYQENKIMDAALTGSIETSISFNPTTLSYLESQAENKTDIGKAYSNFKEGNATRADKMMLSGSLAALDKIRVDSQNMMNTRAAMVAMDNAFPATESGEPQFNMSAYLQSYTDAGGTDPRFALQVVEQSRLAGDITIPPSEQAKAEKALQTREMELRLRDLNNRIQLFESQNTPEALAEAKRLKEEQRKLETRKTESQIAEDLAQAEAAKALAEERRSQAGGEERRSQAGAEETEMTYGDVAIDRQIRQAERGQDISFSQYRDALEQAEKVTETEIVPRTSMFGLIDRGEFKRIPSYDRILNMVEPGIYGASNTRTLSLPSGGTIQIRQ